MTTEVSDLNILLAQSAELENELLGFLTVPPHEESERVRACRAMCSLSFEHAESVKILIATGNFTSATGLVRLQYEAVVRSMWLYYAASETAVSKLMCELTAESSNKANKLPMLSEMLEKLEGKAPDDAVSMLLEFKEYSWRPLSSFVHGGIHAIHRHSKGYPAELLYLTLKHSNGISMMVGMLLVILEGGGHHRGRMPQLQERFKGCLPMYRHEYLKSQKDGKS